MEVFHCMRCGKWPAVQPENRQRFFLSACGRLVCETCLVGQNHKCSCQQSDRCKLAEITQQVGKDVKDFFASPMSLFQDALMKPFQVLKFQASIQKSFTRNVVKVYELAKTLKNDNDELKHQIGSLKLENNHLRQANEKLQQQNEQLNLKVCERSQVNSSTIFLNSQHSTTPNRNQGCNQSDPFNLFQEVAERPNAQVLPNVHHQQRSAPPTPMGSTYSNRISAFQNATTGFNVPSASPAPSATSSHNRNQLFSQISGFSQPFSVSRSSNASPATFETPPPTGGSQFSGGLPSPFSKRIGQQPSTSLDGSTPEIINRLRGLNCKATPSVSPRSFGRIH